MQADKDRYEALLRRYDWHAAYPPPNYVVGAGRGAKGFVTTAELAAGEAIRLTQQEREVLSALDRIQKGGGGGGGRKTTREGGHRSRGAAATTAGAAPPGMSARVRLTLDDLKTLDLVGAPPSLVKRAARDDDTAAAEQVLSHDDVVITAADLHAAREAAPRQKLLGLLEQLEEADPEQQVTWINRAHAHAKLGHGIRARQMLEEGCQRAGAAGPRIWLELLRTLEGEGAAVSQRAEMLYRATHACPASEELWLQLLALVSADTQLRCLRAAVTACPASETLKLRWLQLARPAPEEERRVLAAWLQSGAHLPALRARLARLQPTYQEGRRLLAAAARAEPTLQLAVETSKFVEESARNGFALAGAAQVKAEDEEVEHLLIAGGFSAVSASAARGDNTSAVTTTTTAAAAPPRSSRRQLELAVAAAAHADMEQIIRDARERFLRDPSQPRARAAWLQTLESLVLPERTAPLLRHDFTPHPWSAAYMMLTLALPQLRVSEAMSSPFLHRQQGSTLDSRAANGGMAMSSASLEWLDDVMDLLAANHAGGSASDTAVITQKHGLVCALCGALALYLQASTSCSSSSNSRGGVSPVSADEEVLTDTAIDAVRAAVRTAPEESVAVFIREHGDACRNADASHSVKKEMSGEGHSPVKQENTVKQEKVDDDDDEEGGPHGTSPQLRTTVSSAASTLIKQEPVGENITRGTPTEKEALYRPLSTVLNHFLSGPVCCHGTPLGTRVALTVAQALYQRRAFSAALQVLSQALSRVAADAGGSAARLPGNHNSNTESATATATASLLRLRLHLAIAKTVSAMGDDGSAEAALREATRLPGLASDTAHVKLAILLRSHADTTTGEGNNNSAGGRQAVIEVLTDGLRRFPRSERLWLMRLEEARGVSLAARRQRQEQQGHAHAPSSSLGGAVEQADLALRRLCNEALGDEHCGGCVAVWVYVAVVLDARLRGSPTEARARLQDAEERLPAAVVASLRAAGPAVAMHAKSSVALALATARVRVELAAGAAATAHEVADEALQAAPKAEGGRGLVAAAAGAELLALYVDLSPPATRPRAAGRAVQWGRAEPLVLGAVARLYHAAGERARALAEALKAVRRTERGPRCGDAVALLWKLASLPSYARETTRELQRLGLLADDAEQQGTAAAVALVVPAALVRAFVVCAVLRLESAREPAADTEGARSLSNPTLATAEPAAAAVSASSAPFVPAVAAALASDDTANAEADADDRWWPSDVVPNNGPLWIEESKQRDPTNVTLTGYRDSVVAMLRRVAERIDLDRK